LPAPGGIGRASGGTIHEKVHRQILPSGLDGARRKHRARRRIGAICDEPMSQGVDLASERDRRTQMSKNQTCSR
jgi:hypothetical protein